MHLLPDGDAAGSFDVSGELGGVSFDDEDVVRLDVDTLSRSLLLDASARDADWGPADADAVSLPEPGFLPLLAAGLVGLALLDRVRMRTVAPERVRASPRRSWRTSFQRRRRDPATRI